MRIQIDVDAGLVTIASAIGFLVVGALHVAYPGLFDYWPKNSSDLAAWVQAIGALAAIHFAGRHVLAQLQGAERHQARVQREVDLASIWSCLHAARDAAQALDDLSDKLGGQSSRPPSSSTERIEGLEETIRSLLAGKPHHGTTVSLLKILAELAYSKRAIKEYTGASNNFARQQKSLTRAKKVHGAVESLSKLYAAIDAGQVR